MKKNWYLINGIGNQKYIRTYLLVTRQDNKLEGAGGLAGDAICQYNSSYQRSIKSTWSGSSHIR